MNTLVDSPLTAAPAGTGRVWSKRWPIAVAVLALFGWLLWSVSARQALLLLVGVGLGWALAAARFGFTTGWRHLIEQKDPSGVYGQIVLLAVLAALSMPLLAQFPETQAALGPPSVSLLVGAFVFGLAMQISDGCGSGTLYKAGLGVPLNMAILPLFALGSFAGSAHLNGWLALGALQPVGLVQQWGAGTALAATLAALAVVAVGVGRWSGQRFSFNSMPRRWLWGALAIALFAALNLLIAGQPWGVVYGFGLWGAKAATALGLFDPAANAFWSDPGHAERLHQTLLLDVTSITNIGILAGALWVAPRRPQDARPLTGAQWAVGLLAGFVLGYSSRLAFGCNVGAMVSGISTGSLHGWIWVPMAFAGSLIGVRVRRRLGF
ncbi:YeeE/YedE thiosulfate transporter family protein [Ottowia sp.]|uniref:YeeE/YedE thiosulfate transporter family protein n=1 Tax=Ottowia sp. TaxID=1898956 RepID=UPI002C6EA6D0|nr:YeeE/YedE thiosulfate transporter family protein [Ottowia sp.]HOB67306.1 YeeE/YedE thiosulfate transporter family protein [Ottowia sp.]HPZ58456.1 YeeE/YedE thiosulfate transporter family protein [Ottowia sp.]HQD48916.1 YeeE/YedE thiosulfate transporter family protein [Ottowia sp.]